VQSPKTFHEIISGERIDVDLKTLNVHVVKNTVFLHFPLCYILNQS
jgi:hypothetical protein